MIILNSIPVKKSIKKAYLNIAPVRKDFDRFKDELRKLLSSINEAESEEHNKKHIIAFLENSFYKEKYVNTKEKADLVIHLGKTPSSKAGVLIEAKSPSNKYDMITKDKLNSKAMHEVILYYLRERIEHNNDEIKNIIITNSYQWFIFDAGQFERLFYKSGLKNEYEKWKNNEKVSSLNEHFYNEIVRKYLTENDLDIDGVFFDLREYEKYLTVDEKKLIPLFKKLSPPELLKEAFTNDSNTLNKQFYSELLHIIGLEEGKQRGKKLIQRKEEIRRNWGSFLENTIRMLEEVHLTEPEKYGETKEEQLYNIALELCITWINRILFTKLLEAQLVNYHKGDNTYKFLDVNIIRQFDHLYELFHKVLAVKTEERDEIASQKFANVPYLNSSLFEISELERATIVISILNNELKLPVYAQTKLGKEIKVGNELPALEYLLRFLDAYDFAAENAEDIKEDSKTIINASVLGLIFEKINGYKEGSFYTPGFITMYMAHETLRKAVVHKFNEVLGKDYIDYEELKKNIDTSSKGRDEANKIINSIRICDPAVGSGHFLVSCLNELIAIKADLRILTDRQGRQMHNYSFVIENDELIITDEEKDEPFKYYLNPGGKPIPRLQELQETLFHEKETLIESCLFGVDINPNSVNICRLRLWIELLKNSYYTKESAYSGLETLPNIDINIKQGNSLISRFDVRQNIFTGADKSVLDVYRLNVSLYKDEQDKNKRRDFKNAIEKTKERFRGIALDPLYKEKEHLEKITEQLYDLNVENPLFKHEDSAEKKAEVDKKRAKLTEKINKLTEQIEIKTEEYKTIYSNSFEWRFEFPEVLDADGDFVGFDVVIGNPPYISNWELSAINRELVIFYEHVYKDYLKGHWDIFNCFIPKGLSLIKESAILNFILPTSVLKEKHSTEIRNHLINEKLIIEVVDFMQNIVFEDVARQVCILFIQNISSLNSKIKFKNEDFADIKYVPQQFFLQLKNSIIKSNVTERDVIIFKKLHSDSDLLGELVCINTGVVAHSKLGSKIKFTKDDVLHKEYKEGYKKYVIGENLEPYLIKYTGDYLDYESKKNNFHRPKYPLLFESEKLIVRRISGRNNRFIACYDNSGFYSNDNLMHLVKWNDEIIKLQKPEIKWNISIKNDISLKYILAIINSQLNTYYFSKFISSDTLQGSYSGIYPEDIRVIPIKKISKVKQKSVINIVEKILKTKPKSDTYSLEKQIDEMVYELYGLTEEEIKIVDNSI